MITISDIQNLQNCEIYRYSGYKWVKDNVPGYSECPGHEHMVDLSFPETKHFHYSDLQRVDNLKSLFESGEILDLFLIPGYLQFGVFDSSCMVERSNKKIFIEDYENSTVVYEVTGGYGSESVALSIREMLNPDNAETTQSIIDCLNGLSDYPCLDDEDMSNMEYEAFYEALKDYGIDDTQRALSKKYGITVYDYNRDKLEELILEIDRNGNPVFMIESGGSCYIDIDDSIVPKITRDQFISVLTDYEVDQS